MIVDLETAAPTVRPPVTFNDKWCKKCGICIRFCPVKVLEAGPSGVPKLARPDECTYCGLCENLCPDYAAVVGRRPKKRGDAR